MNQPKSNSKMYDDLKGQIKKSKGPKKWLLIALLLVGILFGVDTFSPIPNRPETDLTQSQIQAINTFDGANFDSLPKMTHIPIEYVRVVDGDTILASLNGEEFRIRYLMIDTPESVAPGVSEQPYGKDASDLNDKLLRKARQITMMFDEGPKTDNYNRALAYVYADGLNLAQELLEEGLAVVRYVNPPNNSLEDDFRQAQDHAQKASIGVWSIRGYVNDKGQFNRVN